jgi:hypothetical protein
MNMIVRPKRGESSARRRGRARIGRGVPRATVAADPASTKRTGIVSERPAPRNSRKRTGGPSEDTAVYSCQCGLVFEASVSTTVGCPHCGHTQAW